MEGHSLALKVHPINIIKYIQTVECLCQQKQSMFMSKIYSIALCITAHSHLLLVFRPTHTHRHQLTGASELVALDLCNAFVGKAARAGAARSAGLYGVWTQEVGQPLHITVTHKRVLGQVPDGKSQGGKASVRSDWMEWNKEKTECAHRRPHSVWMLCSELKVPLARLWILLSYSDSRAKFSRSLNTMARIQWILFAFSNLQNDKTELLSWKLMINNTDMLYVLGRYNKGLRHS